MQGWGDALFEMDYRTKSIETELEQDRLARLAAASRRRDGMVPRSRRMVVRLGELLVGLGCLLQARLLAGHGPAGARASDWQDQGGFPSFLRIGARERFWNAYLL
jgi:hypothetical protein